MKKIFLIFAFLLSANLAWASKDSVTVHPFKTIVLPDTTINDGWNDSWSPEPLPQKASKQERKEERRQEKAEKKAARKQEREDNPSNFPRGVAWSSVALALIGLIKIAVQNCK